jgi:hypothetical protein
VHRREAELGEGHLTAGARLSVRERERERERKREREREREKGDGPVEKNRLMISEL